MKQLIIILASILCTATILAQSTSGNPGGQLPNNNGNIQLPVQSNPELIKLRLITNPEMTAEWKAFTARHGSWSILFDEATGLIHKAFGEAIQLNLSNMEEATIVEAGKQFLSENSNLFGVDTKNLKLSSFSDYSNKLNIGFKQYYKDLEVVLSKINLKIHHNGNLSAFSAQYYPIPEMNVTNPMISAELAANLASIGLTYNIATDESNVDNKLYILPYTIGEYTEYRLVYRVEVKIEATQANYFTYVDAMDGRILWRQNMTMNAKSSVTSTAPVRIKHSREPAIIKNLPDQFITVGSTKYTTDIYGKIDVDITDSTNVNATFESKWTKVTMKSGPRSTANLTTKLLPGQNLVIDWNDTNSHKFERSLFYHANLIHDYAKEIDPSMSFMDFSLALTIYFNDPYSSGPNAMSQGTAISFLAVGVSTYNLSECSSVLYHEYGHSINGLLYKQKGSANGMANLSCNEGTADLFSCLNLDDPRVGFGYKPSDTNQYIRTLKNRIIYPDSLHADGHYNGQILGGAFWDLREVTDLDYVRHLSHFTKYGLPDDPDIGKAFSDWFIETLLEDDDDGNIGNGTPNFLKIVESFNNHHIGTDLLMKMGFSHTQYSDTRETVKPYNLDFKIDAISVAGFVPQNVKLLWSIDDFKTTNSADATFNGNGSYSASVPAQKAGSIVRYYMSADDPITNNHINFRKGNSSTIPFQFLVGFKSIMTDSCETIAGWQTYSVDDNASKGKWENGKPNQINLANYGYGIVQPGKNHTANGVNCWVTGAKGTSSSFTQYMPDGRTTLTSPLIDITNLTKPIIKYYKWFANNYLMSELGLETYWRTAVSIDSGNTWTIISSTKDPTINWEVEIIQLSKFLKPNTTAIKIRFIFDAPLSFGNTFPYSFNEGLVDDFEVLSVDESLVGVETQPVFTSSELTITPNPVMDYIEIDLTRWAPLAKWSPSVEIRIFNVLGEIQTTPSLRDTPPWKGGEKVKIDVSGLAAGMYFLRIGDKVGKFVKL